MEFKKSTFMPFTVLGDPSPEDSLQVIDALIKGGADALELGFAFSDPIADGPVIQKADQRALENGITTAKAFEILEKTRASTDIPISLMLSFNIMYRYGTERFYKKCKELKVNAILCPDVPLEESEELVAYARKYGINQVFLVAPTTTEQRMKKISQVCSGYIYLVSLLGTTGKREELNEELKDLIRRTKKATELPVYVGFGISKPEHAEKAIQWGADGVICGSAICSIIETHAEDPEKMHQEIIAFCKEMKLGIKSP